MHARCPFRWAPLPETLVGWHALLLDRTAAGLGLAKMASMAKGLPSASACQFWSLRFDYEDKCEQIEYEHTCERIEYEHTCERIEYDHTCERIEYEHTCELIEYEHTLSMSTHAN
jgi:hypothetical protein